MRFQNAQQWWRIRPGEPDAPLLCAFEPVDSVESRSLAREDTTTDARLYLPYDVDLRDRDVVRDPKGRPWSVEGEPARWESPFRRVQFGAVARVRRIRGGLHG